MGNVRYERIHGDLIVWSARSLFIVCWVFDVAVGVGGESLGVCKFSYMCAVVCVCALLFMVNDLYPHRVARKVITVLWWKR